MGVKYGMRKERFELGGMKEEIEVGANGEGVNRGHIASFSAGSEVHGVLAAPSGFLLRNTAFLSFFPLGSG